jgi:hypothetical protein
VGEIAKAIGEWMFEGGKSIGERIRDIVQTKLESELLPGFAVWSARLEDGRNEVFTRYVLDRSRAAAESIRQQWAATIGHDELLKGLPAPPPFHAESLFDPTTLDAAVGEAHILMTTFGQIAKILIPATLRLLTISVDNYDVFIKEFRTFIQDVDTAIVFRIAEGLEKQLRSTLQKKRDVLIDELAKSVAQYRTSCVGAIREPLDQVGASFAAGKAQADKDWKRDMAEQEAIAIKSNYARTKHIAPMRERLERFVAETTQLCGETTQAAQS